MIKVKRESTTSYRGACNQHRHSPGSSDHSRREIQVDVHVPDHVTEIIMLSPQFLHYATSRNWGDEFTAERGRSRSSDNRDNDVTLWVAWMN
ncbi:hypothetical protein PoB_003919300 [Plakobranchus ocellatus]|uniref:Uncharacterized protein n=1 Tax=Plakobranchus ocellatus TaxID=259542 RepID=A0AAV4B1S3_9GAST|nr:hypothetical protein PoB_003919300 [Plakobranchus ocellatus]